VYRGEDLFFAITVGRGHENDPAVERCCFKVDIEAAVIPVRPCNTDGSPGRLLTFRALADGVGDERGLVAHGMVLSFEAGPNARRHGTEAGAQQRGFQRWPQAPRRGAELHKPKARKRAALKGARALA
jgi:hypothetical protein